MDPIIDQPGLTSHLRGIFDDAYLITYFRPKPRLLPLAPHARVLKVATPETGDPAYYVTYGLNGLVSATDQRLEYAIVAPRASDTHAQTLDALMAHCFEHSVIYEEGDVLILGRPWLEGSRMDRLLVSAPYPLGPKFEFFDAADHGKGRILWLQPIHEGEHAFVQEAGLKALQNRFEHAGIDVLAADRAPVA